VTDGQTDGHGAIAYTVHLACNITP